jgi:hypothetical protein
VSDINICTKISPLFFLFFFLSHISNTFQQPYKQSGGVVGNIARPPSVWSPQQPQNPFPNTNAPASSTTFQSPTHLDFFNASSMPDASEYDNTPMDQPTEFPTTNVRKYINIAMINHLFTCFLRFIHHKK